MMNWLGSLFHQKALSNQHTITVQEATSLLQKADQLDGYRRACEADWMNRTARRGQTYRPWHDQSFASELETYPCVSKGGARCIIMDSTADGGMPHTRAPNLICIPAYYSDNKEKLDTLLHHEMTHIDQRNNTAKWMTQLEQQGWMAVEEHEIPVQHRRRCRFNPDTLYARWMAWEGRYVPLPIFLREDAPVLRDVTIRWWDIREQRLLHDPPTSFVRRYGSSVSQAAQEHPFELFAYDAERTPCSK